MFTEIVGKEVERFASVMVTGEFHIGLEAVERFVLFVCMANYHQKQQELESQSIFQFAQSQFKLTEKQKKKLTPEKAEAIETAFYERKLDHYNTMNVEKKIELLLRQKQESHDRNIKKEKNQNEKGNAKRFQGNNLFPYQIDEFSILDSIKEGKHENIKANLTYKRFVAEQGNLKKMTFKDYKAFVDLLKREIEELEGVKYKNIQYYKLEKRLGFEVMKSVLKAFHQCKEIGDIPESIAIKDLCLVLLLPCVSERQKYAEVYPELNLEQKMIWRIEIQGLLTFVRTCVTAVQQKVDECKDILFEKQDWELFQTIYLPETFQNDYKQRKDFSSEVFTLFMQELDKNNKIVQKQLRSLMENRLNY